MTSPSDAEQLARRFHEAYERLAPNFGYATREDTRAFDPNTPNGKLMIAVCAEIAAPPPTADIPDNERWLHEPKAKADLERALAVATKPSSDARAVALLREGEQGFGRLLIATSDDKAVRDWQKRVRAYLSTLPQPKEKP